MFLSARRDHIRWIRASFAEKSTLPETCGSLGILALLHGCLSLIINLVAWYIRRRGREVSREGMLADCWNNFGSHSGTNVPSRLIKHYRGRFTLIISFDAIFWTQPRRRVRGVTFRVHLFTFAAVRSSHTRSRVRPLLVCVINGGGTSGCGRISAAPWPPNANALFPI